MDDRWTPGEDDDAFPRRDQESGGKSAPPPPPAGAQEGAEAAQPRNPYVLPTAPAEREEPGLPGARSGAERPYPSDPGASGGAEASGAARPAADDGFAWKAPPRPSGRPVPEAPAPAAAGSVGADAPAQGQATHGQATHGQATGEQGTGGAAEPGHAPAPSASQDAPSRPAETPPGPGDPGPGRPWENTAGAPEEAAERAEARDGADAEAQYGGFPEATDGATDGASGGAAEGALAATAGRHEAPTAEQTFPTGDDTPFGEHRSPGEHRTPAEQGPLGEPAPSAERGGAFSPAPPEPDRSEAASAAPADPPPGSAPSEYGAERTLPSGQGFSWPDTPQGTSQDTARPEFAADGAERGAEGAARAEGPSTRFQPDRGVDTPSAQGGPFSAPSQEASPSQAVGGASEEPFSNGQSLADGQGFAGDTSVPGHDTPWSSPTPGFQEFSSRDFGSQEPGGFEHRPDTPATDQTAVPGSPLGPSDPNTPGFTGDQGFSWQNTPPPADPPPHTSTSDTPVPGHDTPWSSPTPGSQEFSPQDFGSHEPGGFEHRPDTPATNETAVPGSPLGPSDPDAPGGAFRWQSASPPPEPASETIAQGFEPSPFDATGDGSAPGDGFQGGNTTPPGGLGAARSERSYLDETSNPAFPNTERSPFPESDELSAGTPGGQTDGPADAYGGGSPTGGDAGPGTQTFAVPSGLSAEPPGLSSDPSAPSDPSGTAGGSGGFPPPPGPPVPPGPGGAHGGPGTPDGPGGSDWDRGAAGSGGTGGYGGPGGPSGPFDDDPAPKRRSRKGLFIGIGAAVLAVVLAGGVTAWFVLTKGSGPEGTADSYAAAWAERDYAKMAELSTGGDAEKVLTRIDENLGVEKAAVEVGEVSESDGSATAPFTATLSLSSAGDWTYKGELPLTRQDGAWKVDFGPAVVHPELTDDTTLTRANVLGERGSILAADGSRLDTEDASGSIRMLTGTVGAAEEEDLERLGPAYEVGDPVGQGGIQQQYEERLAGDVSTSVRVAPVGEEEAAAEDPDAPVVATIEGTPGKDVTTAIDPGLQDAAAAAVTTEGKPTSLVAVRASTGEVLAVANNAAGFNRALDGQYAPGSSLKIITYESLLENGMTTSDPMNCPEEALGFKNAGDAAYGAQTMTEAFATSCNTALVQETVQRLSGEQLTATAEEFGMNAELNVGVPARKPSFPTPDGDGLLAAQSIGQGRVISTPLHMATVPAAIADGSWRSPALVTEPALEDKPEPAPIAHAEQIRPMMREVVTDGTAKSSGFEGEVYAKTGSAEFGTASGEDDELETHAWVVGYKGDIAFAVVVEGGGGGGSVAGPVAAKFANTL